ncbi:hypothetical protein WA026_011383 [Henosepilachna vigintioctopunctata]|uniref:Uncharacterized protein n=1 Tax=Henosepilachna vigintioctopunctata TaxID=420089 RepID=A0AAW1TKP9_9CUCU
MHKAFLHDSTVRFNETISQPESEVARLDTSDLSSDEFPLLKDVIATVGKKSGNQRCKNRNKTLKRETELYDPHNIEETKELYQH